MKKYEPSIISMIVIPAVISNLATIVRLILELRGYGPGMSPRQITWWVALWPLIFLAGIYFAFLLRDAERPFRRLVLTLLVYAFSVRIVTAVIYGLSGPLGWHTHYSIYGPPGSNFGYILGGLLPQLILWPIITMIGGSITGMPTLILLRSGKRARAASA